MPHSAVRLLEVSLGAGAPMGDNRDRPGGFPLRDATADGPEELSLTSSAAVNEACLPPGARIVVAQLAFIGDMVFTTPLLDALRARWPACRIAVVGRPRALEVLEDHPAVDDRLPYDKDGSQRGGGALFSLGRRIAALEPAAFLGVTRSPRTALLATLSRAPLRVGFAGPGRWLAYHRRIPHPGTSRPLPARPLALLGPLGIDGGQRPLHLEVGVARRRRAEEDLRAAGWRGRTLVALAPGANYATKRWPEERVAGLLDLLAEDGDVQVALYGGPAEKSLIARLSAGRGGKVLDRGCIGLARLAAEFVLAQVVLCGDSGPLHIARGLGRRVVGLFGPTDPALVDDGRAFPVLYRGLDCQPCSPHGDPRCPLEHHRCMEEIGPERVLAALRAALEADDV